MNTNKQLAIAGAELLGINVFVRGEDVLIDSAIPEEMGSFDPANNANDMNKLVEALKITIEWDCIDEIWSCFHVNERDSYGETVKYYVEDKSRDTAIHKCVCKALGVE